jgi:hypothetical protein
LFNPKDHKRYLQHPKPKGIQTYTTTSFPCTLPNTPDEQRVIGFRRGPKYNNYLKKQLVFIERGTGTKKQLAERTLSFVWYKVQRIRNVLIGLRLPIRKRNGHWKIKIYQNTWHGAF